MNNESKGMIEHVLHLELEKVYMPEETKAVAHQMLNTVDFIFARNLYSQKPHYSTSFISPQLECFPDFRHFFTFLRIVFYPRKHFIFTLY